MAKGVPKRKKIEHRIRAVLADNVLRLMDKVFADSANRPKALAEAAGVWLSTVQRVINAENGATADNIGHLADALHVHVYQLFIPGLNVSSPQTLRGSLKARPKRRNEQPRVETHRPGSAATP